MKIINTTINEVKIIEPVVYGDQRGWFMETWTKELCKNLGAKNEFVQDNQSFSAKKGTLRGLHFQNAPYAQTKIVRCTLGEILDVAVDIRKGSPTYKKWVAVVLSAENKKQLFIPRGFAHGFVALTDNVEIIYKCDNLYNKGSDRSIKYNDDSIGVKWNITNPLLSEKDKSAPLLSESDCNFVYGEII